MIQTVEKDLIVVDGSCHINKGLKMARSLLCQINHMGLPVGCELLDTISPQFLADLFSWAAIGGGSILSCISSNN